MWPVFTQTFKLHLKYKNKFMWNWNLNLFIPCVLVYLLKASVNFSMCLRARVALVHSFVSCNSIKSSRALKLFNFYYHLNLICSDLTPLKPGQDWKPDQYIETHIELFVDVTIQECLFQCTFITGQMFLWNKKWAHVHTTQMKLEVFWGEIQQYVRLWTQDILDFLF